MPPKPKYTKEEIVLAAYEMTREKGIDSVVAREVGKRLGTSVSPVFTMFENMEDLKGEVLKLTKHRFMEYMEGVFDYQPAFKAFGIQWVRFAVKEPNLYKLLFLTEREKNVLYDNFRHDFSDMMAKLIAEIASAFAIAPDEAEGLLNQMLVHANGIAALSLNKEEELSEEEISRSLSEVCIGIVTVIKLRNGSFDLETAKRMAYSTVQGINPQKK